MDTFSLKNTSTSSSGRLAGLVIGSVVLFILAFSSAGSWLVLVEHAIPSIGTKDNWHVKGFAITAVVLTIVTLGLALAFAFATRDLKAEVPLDFATVIKNVHNGLREKEKQPVPFEI